MNGWMCEWVNELMSLKFLVEDRVMKVIKLNLVLVGLVFWVFCGFGWAQTGQEVFRVLRFESSEQNEEWYRGMEGLGVIQPKFVAVLNLRTDRDFILQSF